MKMKYFKFKLPTTVIILWMILENESTSNDFSNRINDNQSIKSGLNQFNNDLLNATNVVNDVQPDLKIEPNSSEYIILSDSSMKYHTFTCSGKTKIKWYFEQYDGSLLTKKNKGSYDEVSTMYVTMFSLRTGTDENTGYYYCAPWGVEEKSIRQYEKIYVFVEHETRLLAYPNVHQYVLYRDSNIDQCILPCRPSLPGVNVTFTKNYNDSNITKRSHYDEKIGFTIFRNTLNMGINYFQCVAQKNNIEEKRTIVIKINATQFDTKTLLRVLNKIPPVGIMAKLLKYLKLTTSGPKYNLSSNLTYAHTVTCTSNKDIPLYWYFEKYDGSLEKKIAHSDIESERTISYFSLLEGSYLDTGYYYCTEFDAPKNSIKQYPKIYIYVPHDTNLIAIPHAYTIIWNDADKDEVIIPCRPTSEDVIVKLFLNGTEITDRFRYDNRKGFTLDEVWPFNYTCVAQRNNISEERIFNIRLINMEISPDLPEYTLTSNSTKDERMFTCKGNEPVQWYFERYDRKMLPKKGQPNKIFSNDSNNYIYLNAISLITATYLDTGYYYCAPSSVESKSIKEFKKIYIFVEHETYLFALPENYSTRWPFEEDNTSILPCRTTSPGINVILYENNIEMRRYYNYDDKIGINLLTYIRYHDRNLTCVAKKNEISTELLFYNTVENHVITHGYSNYATLGQNVTLNCSSSTLNPFLNTVLKWIVPEKMKKQTERDKIDQERTFYLKTGYILLNIQNITVEDAGRYVCNVKIDFQNEIDISFDLEVFEKLSIALKNSSESSDLYCKFKNDCNFEFIVSGYPLPVLECSYKNCTNCSSVLCDESNSNAQITYYVKTLSPASFRVVMFMNVTEAVVLTLNATNKFGNSIRQYRLWITETDNTLVKANFFSNMLSTTLGVILIGGPMLYIMKRKLKKKKVTHHKTEFEMGTVECWNPNLGVEEQAHLLPYDNRWEIPVNKIVRGEQIGSGNFGIVYKGEVTGLFNNNMTTTVAIKTVKPGTDQCHTMALASELKIMTHLGRHLNVVNLLGACTEKIDKKLMVIVEYCCYGSIDKYMKKHRNGYLNQMTSDGSIDFKNDTSSNVSKGKPLCTNDLLCWCYQVSKGMDFLASRKILHGDLAARNILLAEENVVKICDFGLAKNMYNYDLYRKSKKAALPIKWLAIESMCDGVFSTKSDVWSFGVVLWEIFSLAAVPYPNVQFNDLLDKLVQGYRMGKPAYSNAKIYDIMLDCWKTESSERPSFSDLVIRMGDLLQECSKVCYATLNDHHMEMYENILPSTDILNRLAALNRSNNSLATDDSCSRYSVKNDTSYVNIDENEN